MSSDLLSLLCGCFGIRRGDEIDERTRLLDPDTLPPAQPQPLQLTQNTEEELRLQSELRKIVQEASERIISINAPGALLQVRPDSPQFRPRTRSIETESSSAANDSGWRAINGDTPAPQPNGRARHPRYTDASVHSLRAIAAAQQSTPTKKSKLSNGLLTKTDHESTLNSFRTAEGADESAEEMPEALMGEIEEPERPPLEAELLPVTEEEDRFMSEAIAKLEEAMQRTFELVG